MLVLITGGARSGKSGFAEAYAAELSDTGYYIATSQALDEEMEERIALHRTKRELDQSIFWHTVEEPVALADALQTLDRGVKATGPQVVLVDCLTLWLTNVLLSEEEPEWDKAARHRAAQRAEEAIHGLIESLLKIRHHHVLLVTNEVGSGIVPEYPLGRLYRDLAGIMNRRLAAVCQEVYLVTAGIPVELKRLQKELAAGGTKLAGETAQEHPGPELPSSSQEKGRR
ncbi:bifunctional adenosylcobinamide kinase/adenosylcobinamide-phosphate guanylyltransferase [Paenibacillus sp. YN15]|uniref:bifunctional adenosylcobinamide kinase/adenosylcobinamide-phosphate guanylyltransferase n=1 Tax=Paenibacillus sp. YN15 TaxID=1742774 RepID=UPI000DCEA2E6|nr:bifunctional adenosylcobinamide kinase/adenosylcobinamide-phosphate guanylyltransferase [Paenibacillus sp. YN15]RAU97616.1 bifunctional adenosylcobinamide kinase/adenosylcobinamide-phosphate guanylyltransferase [Paenibacillus sp. YN15]